MIMALRASSRNLRMRIAPVLRPAATSLGRPSIRVSRFVPNESLINAVLHHRGRRSIPPVSSLA